MLSMTSSRDASHSASVRSGLPCFMLFQVRESRSTLAARDSFKLRQVLPSLQVSGASLPA